MAVFSLCLSPSQNGTGAAGVYVVVAKKAMGVGNAMQGRSFMGAREGVASPENGKTGNAASSGLLAFVIGY